MFLVRRKRVILLKINRSFIKVRIIQRLNAWGKHEFTIRLEGGRREVISQRQATVVLK